MLTPNPVVSQDLTAHRGPLQEPFSTMSRGMARCGTDGADAQLPPALTSAEACATLLTRFAIHSVRSVRWADLVSNAERRRAHMTVIPQALLQVVLDTWLTAVANSYETYKKHRKFRISISEEKSASSGAGEDELPAFGWGVGDCLVGLAELAEQPVAFPGREALLAALIARNAAIEGEIVAVDAFSQTWLGLSKPERWREAVEAALLGDWVNTLGTGQGSDPAVVWLLRRHADIEHRFLQPLWERTVGGKKLALLSTPTGPNQVLGDLLVDGRLPEDTALGAEYGDSRIVSVLRALGDDEAMVADQWAWMRDSWEKAAVDTGQPAAYGERVRRKLKRLGKRYEERQANAAAGSRTEPSSIERRGR